MPEEFRDIPEWPGYRVSNRGRVQSCRDNGANLSTVWNDRKPRHDKDGYLKLKLHRNQKTRYVGVHVLVAEAFIGQKPFPKAMVLHKNGIRDDNAVDNLRWGSGKENADDRDADGKTARADKNGRAKLTVENVHEIRRLRASGFSFGALSKIYGVYKSQTRRVCNGKAWSSVPIEAPRDMNIVREELIGTEPKKEDGANA